MPFPTFTFIKLFYLVQCKYKGMPKTARFLLDPVLNAPEFKVTTSKASESLVLVVSKALTLVYGHRQRATKKW